MSETETVLYDDQLEAERAERERVREFHAVVVDARVTLANLRVCEVTLYRLAESAAPGKAVELKGIAGRIETERRLLAALVGAPGV